MSFELQTGGLGRRRSGSRAATPGVEWRLEEARSGEPTLCIGDRYVHSRYAPRREADALVERSLSERSGAGDGLVLLGLGVGHLPDALARDWPGPVLAWDPFPEISREIPRALGPWRRRVRVATGLDELEPELRRWIRKGRRPRILVHPGYGELCRFEVRWLHERVRELLGLPRATPFERARVSPRTLAALTRLPFRAPVTSLGRPCEDQPAVIAAPGPSLEAALPVLARRRGGVVFAALQALRPLQRAGVRVDFVVAPDPLEFERFAEGVEEDFGALLADTSVPPALLDRWPGRTRLFHLRTPHLHELAWRQAGLPIIDVPLMTVSETALWLAHSLGAARSFLVGVDLCGEPHRYPHHRFRARDLRGRPVVTNTHYLAAARCLTHLAGRLGREGHTVARLGLGLPVAGVPGTDLEPLAAALDAAPPFRPPDPVDHHSPELARLAGGLLRRAARTVSRADAGTPTPDGERPNRWADFDELPPERRAPACREALERLARPPARG